MSFEVTRKLHNLTTCTAVSEKFMGPKTHGFGGLFLYIYIYIYI